MALFVLSSEAIFISFKRRSGQGQVKKGQILNLINLDKKYVCSYLGQFFYS